MFYHISSEECLLLVQTCNPWSTQKTSDGPNFGLQRCPLKHAFKESVSIDGRGPQRLLTVHRQQHKYFQSSYYQLVSAIVLHHLVCWTDVTNMDSLDHVKPSTRGRGRGRGRPPTKRGPATSQTASGSITSPTSPTETLGL